MKYLIFAMILLGAVHARADFGEIDLIVRESIENHFREYSREVDLSRLQYYGDPVANGNVLTIESSVWAQEGFTGGWGWHNCTTEILIEGRNKYRDQGSDCQFETE